MKKRWIGFYLLTIALTLLLAQWGSQAVTVIAENTPLQWEHRILIDPGHGGVDGGATSCTGLLESSYNLDIALRLRDLLHLLGYRTQMTRTTDISIHTKGQTIAQKKASDLKERLALAREATVMVSIHQNNFSDSSIRGAQVFYAASSGSRELGEALQSSLISALDPGSRRRAKQAGGIYLMERVICPGVLIECGFLSNPAEEGRLRSPEYQKQLVCVIATTLSRYLSNT